MSNGSPDGRYKEHEFTLDMARRIRPLLVLSGVSVGVTRDDNISVTLTGRANMANQAKADLYVSLHSNASGNSGWSSASGLVVYTYAEGGVRDAMAKNILRRMKAAGVKIFGAELYHASFAVLKYTSMPACLIEYGFHTNQGDVALLKDPAYRDKLAQATAQGILDTLGLKLAQQTRYKITLATVDDAATAQAVVAKLGELGIPATVEEVSA